MAKQIQIRIQKPRPPATGTSDSPTTNTKISKLWF